MFRSFNIKQTIAFGFLCLIIAGCSNTPYRYSFSLLDPQNETMSFEDDNVQFRFTPSSENIQVAIKNKSEHEINLARDNAEYIDSAGESHRIHYGLDYVEEVIKFETEHNTHVTPMTIGPVSEVTGYVWINNWPDARMGSGPDNTPISSPRIINLMEPLLPRYSFEGRGEDLKDSTFNLILPIDSGEYTRNYTFTFMINDVL